MQWRLLCASLLLAAGLAHAAPPRAARPAAKTTAKTRCDGLDHVQCLINQRLVHQLQHGQPDVRQRAAETLGKRGANARAALPALERAMLSDKTSGVREAAIAALATIGPDPKTAVPALVRALTDNHWPLREKACQLLGQLGAGARPAQAPLQKALLSDDREEVRVAAAGGLAAIGPQSKPAVRALEQALTKDAKSPVRAAAMRALAVVDKGTASTMPILVKALADTDATIREGAIDGLAGLGLKAIPTLTQALMSRNPTKRAAAAHALGRIKPPATSAIPGLRRVLKDPDANVRQAAAEALGAMGPKAIASLLALQELLIKDKAANVRAAAARALGKMGSRGAAAHRALRAATADIDPEVRKAATWAVEQVAR